ncbi:UDP-N-acetylmuramoylalanyl-D-glutamyl-2,6-diaminopimelate--D-alanyl-D-alanine ligase [Marinivivus vitaminiproducens]|uniref:UDP-N-acetylmuramoylalanyl-D-glutamyl-2, 6-diaminopimelate--D-alanyl-D-alanine ligase n=1 Tax=Marinivivus vitaminiproducens TaxID=3035935 RepID=UPI0027A46E1A|nr:UDP-N-acetylmuramoylalanyl-D-glutamyl-2,6-diaminopimelate--D-alanyl-D-alanine ligase [Geminicoccaceae bacterium SCSIO 64248]
MSALWRRSDLVRATGGSAHGAWQDVSGVVIDSRAAGPGDLFVALHGPNHDAHAFVGQALAAGAAAALVDRADDHPSLAGLPVDAALLRVADTLKGLERIGVAARARSRARIAAVTGSVGKTSTKEALRHVLAARAATHASAASHNNHWGVPLSLARLPAAARYGVFELGMNHAGEIAALVATVRPHVALITTIAPAHLAFLGSIEAIADAKAEIFDGLEPGGVAVLPADSPQFERLRARAAAAGATIVTFGRSATADCRLLHAVSDLSGSDLSVRLHGRMIDLRIGTPGEHGIANALAVLATVEALGADPVQAGRSLAEVAPAAGRGARVPIRLAGGEALLIDDSYNANPVSMAAGLSVLGRASGRKIAVLGDMLELGPEADRMHAGLLEPIDRQDVDLVFTVGRHMQALHDALDAGRRGGHTASSDKMVPLLREMLRPGDTILVKGSLGSRMKVVVEALTDGEAAGVRPQAN